MNIASTFKHFEKLAVNNSPALLTAVGVAGTITTAVLSARGALRYERLMLDIQQWEPLQDQPDKKERAKLQARCFGPAVVVGGCTIAAVIGANRIGSRRAAAVAAAYTVTSEAYSEYKEKVVEKLGEKKEQAVRDEIAQERINRNPGGESVVLVGAGTVLCYEMFTDRYFESSVEDIKKAMNDTNYQLLNDNYACLTDFYDRIGLPRTSVSDNIGWRSDEDMIDIQFSTSLSPDGRPCVAFDFRKDPRPNYVRLH